MGMTRVAAIRPLPIRVRRGWCPECEQMAWLVLTPNGNVWDCSTDLDQAFGIALDPEYPPSDWWDRRGR